MSDPVNETANEDAVATPRRGRGIRALLISARAATGIVGIAIAVVTIGAATFVPFPTLTFEPPSVTVTPTPAAQQLVCPGSVLRLGDETGANASTATPIGIPSLTRATSSGEFESVPLAAPEAGNAAAAAPQLLSVPPEANDGNVNIAGAQSQYVDTADYRGFAAAECAVPSSDSWLAGGSTSVGRTTLLTIANPGAVASTVSLGIFSEEGEVDAPGTNGIVVAAGSQRVLSLAGFAPAMESLVVHVTSQGGPVVANLQHSVVRGIDPGGLDLVGATAAPASNQVIPGVVILGSEGLAGLLGGEGYDDLGTVLRVFVPGDARATTTVNVIPAGEIAAGASFDVVLGAGLVTDIPIDGLTDGIYTVSIESDEPVVAAMRSSTADGEITDFAWFAAATKINGNTFVSVARGPGASIVLHNESDAAASVTITAVGGQPVAVEVAAGATVSVPVDDNANFDLVGANGLVASVSYSGDGQLAGYLPGAAATQEPPIVIYP